MTNIEIAFRVGKTTGYKCCRCGELLGVIGDDCKRSDSGFEEWNFCPFCSHPLDTRFEYEKLLNEVEGL